MRAWIVVGATCAAQAAISPTAAAKPAPRCSFAGEPAPTAAQRKALESLDFDIDALPDRAGDHRPILQRLQGILDEPCFRSLKNVAALPELGSARAVTEWWSDGGQAWLYSAFAAEGEPRSVVLPPTGRWTLTLEGNERHPLAPLLCRSNDAACGRETEGWLMRAENQATGDFRERRQASVTLCNKVEKTTVAPRYAAWRDCLEGQRRLNFVQSRLPLGPFRAPTSGWLVVRGRRGHYTFSDELAAYDLATGTAYRARRPGDLGILPPRDPDAVERRRTGRAKIIVDRGRLPLDNLREAALLMMLWPERREYLDEMDARLPPGLSVAPLPKNFAFSEVPKTIATSSGDTWLSWDWLDAGKPPVSGKALFTDGGGGSGSLYPSWLLRIAEAGLEPGCPPAALPPGILGRGNAFGGVHPIDASRAQLDDAEAELARALTEMSVGACKRQ